MMEPLLLTATSKHRGPLNDLALELAAQSARSWPGKNSPNPSSHRSGYHTAIGRR